MTGPTLSPAERTGLLDLVPVLERAAGFDAHGLARLRVDDGTATVLAPLPFQVLVSRTVELTGPIPSFDLTARAAELVDWITDGSPTPPDSRDLEWRTGLPPSAGWSRLDSVPDDVVRKLVRSGALALKQAGGRLATTGRHNATAATEALLDAVVLTVTGEDGTQADITLRAVSALTRMGFLPRDSHAHIDVAGRWTRVAGRYGSVYLERPGQTLTLM